LPSTSVPEQLQTRCINEDALYGVGTICHTKTNPAPLLDVSPATWWAGVASGRFPQPSHLGNRTLWRGRDLLRLIERICQGAETAPITSPRPAKSFEAAGQESMVQ